MDGMFNNSREFAINGGTFNNAGRDLSLNLNVFEEKGERGLSTLYHHSSTSASYDAGARYPPPMCLPGTREAILRDLNQWANSVADLHNAPVRWLFGPAGAGKSAIAQTFAQSCAENGTLLGSFFFWRSDPTRNNSQRLFTTLALQMAIAIPGLRPIVDEVVTRNPFLPTSSIEKQCNELIAQPWSLALKKARMHIELKQWWDRLSGLNPSVVPESSQQPFLGRACILIIDGLDECSNVHNEWQHILSILAQLYRKYSLPVQILVCSRPEPCIKECFTGWNFGSICQWLALDDTYQASKDIRFFLQNGFQKILTYHSNSMAHVPQPWPTSAQIEYLLQKSSGQFVYAATVMKYIGEDGDVPADRLNIILGLPVQDYEARCSPYAELDALYLQILSTVKRPTFLLQILSALIVHQKEHIGPKPMHFLQSVPIGLLHATSSGVHSLFKHPSPVESGFEFAHASFPEFLLNCNRSLHFHIDESAGHDLLAQGCLEQYTDVSSVGEYSRGKWMFHCIHANGSDSLISKLDSFPVHTWITQAVKHRICLFPAYQLPSELLPILLSIFQLWYKFQDKCGPYLQHIRDISTIGFTIVGASDLPSTMHIVSIQYPPSLSSAIAEGNTHIIIQQLKAHLISELEKALSGTKAWLGLPEIHSLSCQIYNGRTGPQEGMLEVNDFTPCHGCTFARAQDREKIHR
ncbi:hypothetical protein GYMLUDRAFT_223892 [Collybiopsis luxurians FD-317 M1]|uniref:Nephrocystin 3-like N-terminal domain-containing protein n=1 Tax=Collybiopsis luxurians FD-317 M1 TaxID=944289 RepID=A0A0D0C3E3_9AGAR|nr:hypothetical protein GYMLUDRAFT_223892 [Collybiopsis luxurians FD-317 M1]